MALRNLTIEVYGQFDVLCKYLVVQLNLVEIVVAIIAMGSVVVVIVSFFTIPTFPLKDGAGVGVAVIRTPCRSLYMFILGIVLLSAKLCPITMTKVLKAVTPSETTTLMKRNWKGTPSVTRFILKNGSFRH